MRHLWRAGRTLFVILVGAVLALAVVSPAGAVVASTPAIAVQQGATCAYDTATYVYDAPAQLSSSDAAATYARGSPSRPGVASGVSPASIRDDGVAANTGAARFTVSSAGEATMSLRAGSTSLQVSEHAALRMTQRGISIDAAEATLAQQPFPYFHQGALKAGYYDPASRIFLGSVNGEVTTVIRGASPNYINNLKAATP